MASADRVVIIGSGHAGVSVAAGLRTRGFAGGIVLVDGEPGLPYERPPLSKELLKPGAPDGATPLRKESYFEGKGIERIAGATATSIDRARGTVVLADGREVGYSQLVLATGSRPRRLSIPGADLPGLFMLKTLKDGRALKRVLSPGARVVIVGAGYIGLEVAAAAAKLGCDTTILEFQDRIMSRVTSEPVSRFFEQVHRDHGVGLRFGTAVTALEGRGRVEFVATADGTRYPADVVVAGIGVVPNQDLAEAAGLECSDGVLVDAAGRTSAGGIYAAGDATRFASLFDGASQRLECIQNAQSQADRIAADITGQEPSEPGVPWFWTVQHGVRLQSAGVRQPGDEEIVRGDPATGKFSVAYLRDGRIAAIDTIGGLTDFNPGKKLVAERATLDARLVADPGIPLAETVLPALAPSRQKPHDPEGHLMTTITAIDRDGSSRNLPWEEDQSLMEVLRDNDLPVLASCGGTASCATCHVFLAREVFDSLGERTPDEVELLADAEGYRECGSRLSCQVEHDAALDGITVELAPEG